VQIIRSTEPIPVAHPVVLIYGVPGIGKSTLGYSAADPLLLDFDSGAHRAANRRDTLRIRAWADVEELLRTPVVLDPYQTVVLDTVGRSLDLLAVDIIEANPKYARDGALTLQGYGVLKTRFRLLMAQVQALGKDIVLLAHTREEKDGDVTVMRPDIIGASYGEVMKLSDLVGFIYMRGRERVLDFSPTDRWVGKNPAQWKPVVIPPVDKATAVLEGLFEQGRQALGRISAQSATVAQAVEDWRTAIAGYTTAEDFTRGRVELDTQPEIIKAQLRAVFKSQADRLGMTWDKAQKMYVGPPKPNGAASATPAVTATDLVW
jgi:hypothetical protein